MPGRSTHREAADRALIAEAYQSLARDGLVRHASGNVSLRQKNGFLITPSGMPAHDVTPESIVAMNAKGEPISAGKPSSEWRFHRDIFAARKDVNAVVHTHSPAATALACQRRSLPPFHYMIALAGGDDVRCSDYALFGTQELSDAVLVALAGRKACLMANHGLVACGPTLSEAMFVAAEVEGLCDVYLRSLQAGPPILLSGAEMKAALAAFKTYGPNNAGRRA